MMSQKLAERRRVVRQAADTAVRPTVAQLESKETTPMRGIHYYSAKRMMAFWIALAVAAAVAINYVH